MLSSHTPSSLTDDPTTPRPAAARLETDGENRDPRPPISYPKLPTTTHLRQPPASASEHTSKPLPLPRKLTASPPAQPSAHPFVQNGANIARKRANAISLIDAPARRSHSEEMARIFQRAQETAHFQQAAARRHLPSPSRNPDEPLLTPRRRRPIFSKTPKTVDNIVVVRARPLNSGDPGPVLPALRPVARLSDDLPHEYRPAHDSQHKVSSAGHPHRKLVTSTPSSVWLPQLRSANNLQHELAAVLHSRGMSADSGIAMGHPSHPAPTDHERHSGAVVGPSDPEQRSHIHQWLSGVDPLAFPGESPTGDLSRASSFSASANITSSRVPPATSPSAAPEGTCSGHEPSSSQEGPGRDAERDGIFQTSSRGRLGTFLTAGTPRRSKASSMACSVNSPSLMAGGTLRRFRPARVPAVLRKKFAYKKSGDAVTFGIGPEDSEISSENNSNSRSRSSKGSLDSIPEQLHEDADDESTEQLLREAAEMGCSTPHKPIEDDGEPAPHLSPAVSTYRKGKRLRSDAKPRRCEAYFDHDILPKKT